MKWGKIQAALYETDTLAKDTVESISLRFIMVTPGASLHSQFLQQVSLTP